MVRGHGGRQCLEVHAMARGRIAQARGDSRTARTHSRGRGRSGSLAYAQAAALVLASAHSRSVPVDLEGRSGLAPRRYSEPSLRRPWARHRRGTSARVVRGCVKGVRGSL